MRDTYLNYWANGPICIDMGRAYNPMACVMTTGMEYFNMGDPLFVRSEDMPIMDQVQMVRYVGRCAYCGVKYKQEERLCIACGAPL